MLHYLEETFMNNNDFSSALIVPTYKCSTTDSGVHFFVRIIWPNKVDSSHYALIIVSQAPAQIIIDKFKWATS